MALEWIRRTFGLDPPRRRDTVILVDDFVEKARKFYSDPEAVWEPVAIPSMSRLVYLLKYDARRELVVERMMYLHRELIKLWTRLSANSKNWDGRWREMQALRRFFEPEDGVSRLAQKPLGGYDVRAYAHDAWIFVEIPTFTSVENGTDGVNLTEAKRRTTLFHIVIHELAHVAGYWKHDDKHAACVAWLTKYVT